jgi:hypothetical protein
MARAFFENWRVENSLELARLHRYAKHCGQGFGIGKPGRSFTRVTGSFRGRSRGAG